MSGLWAAPDTWLSAIRRYLAVIAAGNLVWEVAHMPLYTLWQTGMGSEIVFAALHCAASDLLIATVSLVLALMFAGDAAWPNHGFVRVAALTIAAGVGYTVFSEWLNVEVRHAWTYSALMPTLPWLGLAFRNPEHARLSDRGYLLYDRRRHAVTSRFPLTRKPAPSSKWKVNNYSASNTANSERRRLRQTRCLRVAYPCRSLERDQCELPTLG